jgi:hypothetical protein
MVAVRFVVVGLAVAAHCIVASAVPEDAEVIVSHESLLDAVHCRVELLVVMANEPVPPALAAFADDGLIVRTAPIWVTASVAGVPVEGATVIVALRSAAPELPSTEY